MVYLYLTYCIIIWSSTYPTRFKSIFMIQKKIVRIMTFSKYSEESRPLFLSLKIHNIYELNIYQMELFCTRILMIIYRVILPITSK